MRHLLDKVRTDGIIDTWRQVMGRLETPVLLRYSSAGTVVDVGPGFSGYKVGDRVACAGSGYAGHIQATTVPTDLCIPVPQSVSFEEASFVALGGIALEAVRMARVGLGDRVAVIGLGLLGQIAVRLLRASGCHVFGIDLDSQKVALAGQHGAEVTSPGGGNNSVLEAVSAWTDHRGVDAVIILWLTPAGRLTATWRSSGPTG